ncbi:hypothetical protein WN943_028965 [Citrus x changshan-huyou]
MARVPSRQFCPATAIFDSFQSSFSKFHGIICFSQHDKDENANLCSSSSWLDKLNKPNKYNRLKPPQARENHRKNNGNGVGVRGKYIEETRRDEQVSGGRVLRAGVSCKSQVAGE